MDKEQQKKLIELVAAIVFIAVVVILAFTTVDPVEGQSRFYGTIWSLVPPVIAIVLALITKEVHSSLFIGILIGAFFIADGDLVNTLHSIMDSTQMGLETEDVWGFITVIDSDNVGILIFLVVLGVFGALAFKAGGTYAYGMWAQKRIKSRRMAQLATALLGFVLFVDDYFNCLTVGSVMRPVTDKHGISRAKLAYLIDSTAAPICIIAPVSSWAAAVTGYIEGGNGFELFIQSIPYNFYAIFTIVMVVCVCLLDVDFGPMKVHEDNAKKGDLYTTGDRPFDDEKEEEYNPNGIVADLVVPILILIPCCIIMLMYTGGFFDGASVMEAFADCDASLGLSYGSVIALILTVIYLTLRKSIRPFADMMECLPKGFRNMVPAILILIFAWTMCSITRYGLGSAVYVGSIVEGAGTFMNFLPAIFMLLACFISFATGTSWGTFGILLPIVIEAFQLSDYSLMVVGVSACLSGAVFGDHCSPVSDTTIMSSAGAQCNHINHVSTQAPYALLVAAVCFVFFLIAGFWQSIIVTAIGVVVMVAVLFLVKKIVNGREASAPSA